MIPITVTMNASLARTLGREVWPTTLQVEPMVRDCIHSQSGVQMMVMVRHFLFDGSLELELGQVVSVAPKTRTGS